MTVAIAAVAPAAAVAPPDQVNYQGVLRDAEGNPRNGPFDMTFRFFDAAAGGNEILVDRHLTSGTGAVVVSDGLFDVRLGSGAVSDGAAPLPEDPYLALADVFRDFGVVWLQIEIGAEVLVPRVEVASVPYALNSESALSAGQAALAANALLLDGIPPAGFLDTSATGQTKAGSLQVNGPLTAGGNVLQFQNPGAAIQATSVSLNLTGDQPTDDLFLQASPGTGFGNGSIHIAGQDAIYLYSGNGIFNFANAAAATQVATLDGSGNFSANGDLIALGNDLRFGFPGAAITADTAMLRLTAGDAASDDLELRGGNGPFTGRIRIEGGEDIELETAGGDIRFKVNSILDTATLTADGTFAAQDFLARGGDVLFPGGGRVSAFGSQVQVVAGDAPSDDLLLLAGDGTGESAIFVLGEQGIEMWHDSGPVTFRNESGVQTASLSTRGLLTVTNDVVALGNEVHLGTPGSTRIVRNPTFDDLYFARDEDQNHTGARFSIFTNIGVEQMRINDGDEASTFFDGAVNANGLDYAEAFWISDPTLHAGEVVVFDPARPGFISRAAEAYSTLLVGVISEKPGFLTGGSFDAEEAADPVLAREMRAAHEAGNYEAAREISLVLEQKKVELQRPVALAGRLPVKVDASYGAIQAGDHLTSSKTPGHAMAMREAGPSIGVALESWSGPGTGVIMAFVQRGHYTPDALIASTIAAQEELAGSLAARTPDPASGVQVVPSSLQVVLDGSGGEESRFSVFRDGEAASPRAEVFRVDEGGNVWAQGAFRPRSMDVAEAFAVSEPVEPGDVLVVDRAQTGRYARSREAGDPAVVGVVAADPGVLLGGDVSRLLDASPDLAEALAGARATLDRKAEQAVWAEVERRFHAGHAAVALSGTVMVKADAGYGAIAPGDLLVTSPTPGHAMRASDAVPPGAVVGKALESIEVGVGSIRMIVMLR